MDGLFFANGVTLGPNEDYVLVNETGMGLYPATSSGAFAPLSEPALLMKFDNHKMASTIVNVKGEGVAIGGLGGSGDALASTAWCTPSRPKISVPSTISSRKPS